MKALVRMHGWLDKSVMWVATLAAIAALRKKPPHCHRRTMHSESQHNDQSSLTTRVPSRTAALISVTLSPSISRNIISSRSVAENSVGGSR